MRYFYPVAAVFLILFGLSSAQASMPSKVSLAKADWCPFSCQNDPDRPGIIHEYLEAILKPMGIEVTVTTYPWARAVQLATTGKDVHGLLTAVFVEAPDLLLTNTPTAYYQNCFYGKKDQLWRYEGVRSLKSMPEKLGVIKGYSYGHPVDELIADDTGSLKIQKVNSIKGTGRLIEMLSRGRLALLMEERNVYQWYLKRNSVKNPDLQIVGCVDPQPFYLAVNPKLSWSADFIVFLNKAFADPANLRLLEEIKGHYRER
ncbi:substrate-binding periplasmic protein [Sneathiella sp.]|jgi:polar amino acid transport system substrate-binding protein|uniref:substrate-binding periplasmic protein n=1 Tax=Sneathiella sp. TaxID=1964365 RepID=UPI0039E6CADB